VYAVLSVNAIILPVYAELPVNVTILPVYAVLAVNVTILPVYAERKRRLRTLACKLSFGRVIVQIFIRIHVFIIEFFIC
jgi:hypothetical protein